MNLHDHTTDWLAEILIKIVQRLIKNVHIIEKIPTLKPSLEC